jgi:hypothetical protein
MRRSRQRTTSSIVAQPNSMAEGQAIGTIVLGGATFQVSIAKAMTFHHPVELAAIHN